MNQVVEPSLLFSGSQNIFFFFSKYFIELTSEAIGLEVYFPIERFLDANLIFEVGIDLLEFLISS